MRTYLETGISERHHFTLPRRGISVLAHPSSQRILEEIRTNGINGHPVWSLQEKARIRLLRDCRILARRYPDPQTGRDFMSHVSKERCEELFVMAQDLTSVIVESWQQISPGKDIAIILFGSVAKGLVKDVSHPDPSNIDVAVVGEITDDERLQLLDLIRPKRTELRDKIRGKCQDIQTTDTNPGNAGVMVQNTQKLKNGCFSCALNYIAAGAFPLYDPAGIWEDIEQTALSQAAVKFEKKSLRSGSNKGNNSI